MSLPNIGKVAKSALETIDVHQLEDLTVMSEETLSQLHGVGPKAIKILKEALNENNLSLREKTEYNYPVNFAVVGSLSCDNAPKRRYIRDFFIALTMRSQKYMNENATENLQTQVVNVATLNSSQGLIDFVNTKDWRISSLNLETILSHGKDGAASASLILTNGQRINMAGIFNFASHKKDALITGCQLYIMEEN